MSKNLFQLLSCDKLSLVASSLRVSLLLFESLRNHLKYQQEEYLKKMIQIIKDEQNPNHSYELKEKVNQNIFLQTFWPSKLRSSKTRPLQTWPHKFDQQNLTFKSSYTGDMYKSSTQDFGQHLLIFCPNFGVTIGEIWLDSSTQKILGYPCFLLQSVTYDSSTQDFSGLMT